MTSCLVEERIVKEDNFSKAFKSPLELHISCTMRIVISIGNSEFKVH